MDKKQKIIEVLEEMATDELIAVYNEYADINRYEKILHNDIDEILCGCTPLEVYRALDSCWNPTDDYAIFNGYGMLESFSECDVLDYIYIDEIADHIINNEDDLNNSDIQDILDDDEAAE